MSDSVLTKADVTELRELARSSSLRNEQGLVVVEGFRAISGAIAAGGRCERLLLVRGFHLPFRTSRICTEWEVEPPEFTTYVEQNVLDRIATTTSAQGAVGIFRMPSISTEDVTHARTPLFVLDHVSDPGNMGTIFRSCAAFSISAVVTVGGVDPYHPKVVRSSAGTIFGLHVYPAHEFELEDLLENRTLFVADAHSETPVSDLRVSNSSAYVFGNEAHGIQTQFFAHNAEYFTIRMAELCESLNVAMTATIVAHQLSEK